MKEKTKGFIAGALSASVVLGATICVSADNIQKAATLIFKDIKISIDGNYIEPKDANGNKVEPFIIDGTTYLPVRAVGEAFNKDVSWDGKTNTVSLTTKQEQIEKTNPGVIYEDDNVIVSYKYLTDLKAGITVYHLYMEVENKSDKNIMVSLNDAYVNDISVMFLSGMPAPQIEPGKKAIGPFFFGYNNLGIDSIDDVKKIEFDFCVRDNDTLDIMSESPKLTLNF
jgi:hypothetical protein